MTDEEKYFFDLCGYIIVRDALSPIEVQQLNAAIDAHEHLLQEYHETLAGGAKNLKGECSRRGFGGLLTLESPWCDAFRSLLAHPRINPYLDVILGKGFRLDHTHSVIVQEKGCEGHILHGSTGPAFDPNQYYIVRDGRMHNGLSVVTWQTHDVNPGDGGFCLVPGSHKGNFSVPDGLRRNELFKDLIKPMEMKAGDAVIFTEAVLHGTLPWTSVHPRRSILARYTAANLSYVNYGHGKLLEEIGEQLTPDQRTVLEPAYHLRLQRPTIDV